MATQVRTEWPAPGAPITPAPRRKKEPAWRRGMTAAALMAMDFPPINYVVLGYVVEGLTLLAGAPKIGKSWWALGLGVAIASGRPAFGSIAVDQGDVLYLALEDNPRRLQRRMNRMGVTHAPERLTVCTEWPGLDNGCVDEIGEWITEVEKPTLVVVDVLSKVRPDANGKDTSAYDADYRVLTGLQRLAGQYGVAIVVVHHTRKMEADDPFDSVSGTRGLTGAADTVLVFKRDSGTSRTILYGRGRDVEEIETAFEFNQDNGTWCIVGAAHEVGRTDERHEILSVLREAANPMTARDISDIVGKPYDAVRKTLARMAHREEVGKAGRGLYTCPNGPNVPSGAASAVTWDNGTGGTGFRDPPAGSLNGYILAPGETGNEQVPGFEHLP